MTRRHAEPVEVVRRDDVPAQFLWHRRLYLVRDVLAHWVEAGGWWDTPRALALVGGERDSAAAHSASVPLAVTRLPAAPQWGQHAWGEPAPEVGVAAGPAGVDDPDREFWRVEAGAGRHAGTGVFDLCFDWSVGAWSLSRVLD